MHACTARRNERTDESLRPRQRLSRNRDFARVFRKGMRVERGPFVLYGVRNGLPFARLGVRVSKRSGPAVRRTYLRRCVREVFRRWLKTCVAGLDLVVIVRRRADFAEAKTHLERAAARLCGSL